MNPSSRYISLPDYPTKTPPKRRTYLIIGIVLGTILGASLAPVIGLAAIGLNAKGPVAGKPFSNIQSGGGNIAPDSFLAHLQSMAMGGPIRPDILVFVIPGAAIGGLTGGLVGWLIHWIVDRFQKRNPRVKVMEVKA